MDILTSRRRFLKRVGRSSLGLAGAVGSARASSATKSRVVVAHDPQLRGGGSGIDSHQLPALLDRTLQNLFDRDTPQEAWRRVVRPGEVVGLKVNCLAGRGLSSTVLLVDAVCERLREVGIRDIIVWERLTADLESAHFRINEKGSGVRYMGNEVLGYEDDLAIQGSVGSLICKTLTRACDAIINLPVLKDHSITGVTMALKNLYGAIHNPNKYHPNGGNPYIADVNLIPQIRSKMRLHICDALTAQYEGGPSFMPQWTWRFNGLLASLDPVALDYTGWQIIERKRAEKGMKSLKETKREPTYIATAADAAHRLGTNDPNRIELVQT